MDADSDPSQWVLDAVDTHELPLLRYARRLLGDLDLARDAVQHAFVRLCDEPRERLAGRVAPWLYRVCRNKAIDHLRHAGREQALLDGPTSGSSASPATLANRGADDPADIAADHDLAARLRELLRHLPAPQRETIDLWCEGLTYREIAEITGRQEGHVRVLAHRGLTARLTAHALGQLEGQERDDAEARLAGADAADLREAADEMQRLAAALRAARGADLADAEAPARSADLRRTVIARLAAPPSPVAQPPSPAPPRAAFRRAPWGLLAAAGSVAAAVLVAATVLVEQPAAFLGPNRAASRPTTRPEPHADRLAVESDRREAAVPVPEAASREPIASENVLDAERMIAAAPQAMPAGPARPGVPRGPLADGEAASQEFRREQPSRERYARFANNASRRVADAPLSTFGVDVDTASYATIRRFLAGGRLPPRDAVRLEECVNSFRYDDDALPVGDDPFAVTLESATCPWNEDRLLVRIGIRGRDIDRGRRPAGNLVFLIDVSGSMQSPDKLPLVKQALGLLVEELTENDRVAIVTYAGDAGLVLPPTTGDQKATILAAIDRLAAGGSTHGSAGIMLAYEQAAAEFIPGGANRVILATDGDLNVGATSDAALVELIREKAAGGTFLTVLGFGQGNLQDERLEKLADHGNGFYAYVDGVREARKVLVEQLTGSTITIAKDVKLQVEFNPARVAAYRLLGYENRLLAARDFRDDRKDSGDIGAGHTVTALYEITLVGSAAGEPGGGGEPLKYQRQSEPEPAAVTELVPSDELLTVKLRFKRPEGDTSTLREYPLAAAGGTFADASPDLRFAAAVAGFAMILRGGDQTGSLTLDDVARIAGRALGRDEGGYRAEFLDLVRKAAMMTRRPAGRPD